MNTDSWTKNTKNNDKVAEPAEHLRNIDETSDFFELKDFLDFFNVLPAGMAIFDSKQNILVSNRSFGMIWDIDEEGIHDGKLRNRRYLRTDGSSMPWEEFPHVIADKDQRIVKSTVVGLEKEDGSIVWIEICAAPLHMAKASSVIVTREVSDRMRDLAALCQSEQNLQLLSNELEAILDHLPGLVFFKDKDNNFLRVNKYVADAYKREKKELEGVNLYDLHTKDEADKYLQDDLEVINSGEAKLHIEEPWETVDGLRWVSTSKIPFIDNNGEIIGIIGISMDITDRKRADLLIEELIHRLEKEKDFAEKNALTDGLTGIPNRRYLDDTLKREFLRMKRTRNLLSVIILDIDNFKKFNDLYGHLAGDDCLRKVAATLQSTTGRASDFVARFGGEEFVIILPDTKNYGARIFAERIRKAVEDLSIPHEDSDTGNVVTVSLGVVTAHPEKAESLEKILELADNALYTAKKNGRNRFEVATYITAADNGNSEKKPELIQLVWHVSYECGNAMIDEQHKKLFMSANQLMSAIVGKWPKDDCQSLLNDLIHEIKNHFHDEENILDSVDCPLLEDHRRIHANITVQVEKLAEKYNSNQLTIGELFTFLVDDVISMHMFIEDKKFFPYF